MLLDCQGHGGCPGTFGVQGGEVDEEDGADGIT